MASGRLLAGHRTVSPTGRAVTPRIRRLLPLVRGVDGAQEMVPHVEVTASRRWVRRDSPQLEILKVTTVTGGSTR